MLFFNVIIYYKIEIRRYFGMELCIDKYIYKIKIWIKKIYGLVGKSIIGFFVEVFGLGWGLVFI